MVTALEAGPSAVAAERGECVACGRGYGRLRVPAGHGGEPANAEVGLWGCGELVVCDQCWHLAGGTAGVAARLDAAGDALEPVLVLAPEIEALLAEAADFDLLHPLDRLLVDSGVRWAVLRHIAVPARMTLAGWVMRSVAPDGSRSADSARLWLDEVEARIRGQGSGAGFVYTARKRRWWRIAHQLACAAAWERRPLTWMAQEDLAAAVGCSTRTVRRVVAWLRAEGLLWKVDVATKAITQVDLKGAVLGRADGLVLDGNRLYAVLQETTEVVAVDLAPDFASGTVVGHLKDDRFVAPATAFKTADKLYVVVTQFSKREDNTATKPFNVFEMPLSAIK